MKKNEKARAGLKSDCQFLSSIGLQRQTGARGFHLGHCATGSLDSRLRLLRPCGGSHHQRRKRSRQSIKNTTHKSTAPNRATASKDCPRRGQGYIVRRAFSPCQPAYLLSLTDFRRLRFDLPPADRWPADTHPKAASPTSRPSGGEFPSP